ncbi:MAG: recombinase family protein [Pseudomonadales bacterium]|nr:recombinase family protein [Pseudomonadales bacterium]
MRIYAYLRASTDEQDASRAKGELEEFAKKNELKVSSWFTENVSGASLQRPELFRLLDIAEKGDILLVEQVDRISRLKTADWEALKNEITLKGVRVVSLDLPTSHQFLNPVKDDFTARMVEALNAMLLDMLAAVARKDYEANRKRQAQGIKQAKKDGKYKGRSVDVRLHETIRKLLLSGNSYTNIVKIVGCSKSTISAVNKDLKKSLKDDLKAVYLAPF